MLGMREEETSDEKRFNQRHSLHLKQDKRRHLEVSGHARHSHPRHRAHVRNAHARHPHAAHSRHAAHVHAHSTPHLRVSIHAWAHGEHEGTSLHGHVHTHSRLLLHGLLMLFVFLLLLLALNHELINLGRVVLGDLNDVGHGVVHDVVAPCKLHDNIRPDQLKAGEETSGKALLGLNLHKEAQKLLDQLRILRGSSNVHGIFVQLVFL
mmetsp:Transcript_32106/g.102251  ORF Transcript_32106/g.102251 Transcript_32106/m.102251 type:complete len:208 (+) Transcript_32106:37-660(+)